MMNLKKGLASLALAFAMTALASPSYAQDRSPSLDQRLGPQHRRTARRIPRGFRSGSAS